MGNNNRIIEIICTGIIVIAAFAILAAISCVFTSFLIHVGWKLIDVWMGK